MGTLLDQCFRKGGVRFLHGCEKCVVTLHSNTVMGLITYTRVQMFVPKVPECEDGSLATSVLQMNDHVDYWMYR